MRFIIHILIFTIVHQTIGKQADEHTIYRQWAMRTALSFDGIHSEVGTRQKRATQGCELTDIVNRLSSCAYYTATIDASVVSSLSSICGDLECNIKCFLVAVGDCYQTDQTFYLDPTVVRMEYRAMCANQTLTTGMLTDCVSQLFDNQCITALQTTITNAVTNYYVQQDYSNYKLSYCSAISAYASCLNVQPSGNCTSEMAQFSNELRIASTQFEGCGTQTHAFFTTYGGDLECGASPVVTNSP